MTLDNYATFCIYNMSRNEQPFNDWRLETSEIPKALEDFFRISVNAYQVYIFYMLTAKRYGYEIAAKVLSIQSKTLDLVGDGLGKQLVTLIGNIEHTITTLHNKPQKFDVDGREIDVPMEIGLAMYYLVVSDDAPFPVDENGDFPDLNDLEFDLGECLIHGRDSAIAYFSPMVDLAKIRL